MTYFTTKEPHTAPPKLRRSINVFSCFSVLLFFGLIALQLREARFVFRLSAPPPPPPPLRVYRTADDEVFACVVPNVYGCVHPKRCRGPTLFVPNAYRHFQADLTECFGWRRFKFYDGEAPTVARNPQMYDVDVLGASYTAPWFGHFSHLSPGFPHHVIVPASYFLSQSDNKLSIPLCLYPHQTVVAPCGEDIARLRPRILISKDVLRQPGGWVYEMVRMLTTGSMYATKPPRYLHIGKSNAWWESYRSLIISPERYDVLRHDRLFLSAGLSRTPICTGRIVLVTRDTKKQLDRTIPKETLETLTTELRKSKNNVVETIVDMGHLSFVQQVELMQRADVVVTVHGAEMSNILFMRPHAHVIEIHPFGYWAARMFAGIGASVHLNYTALSSAPDRTRFMKCMKRKSQSDKSIMDGIRIFDRRSKNFFDQQDHSKKIRAGAFWMGPSWARRCCRAQVIDFDPMKMANLILNHARNRCNEPGLGR